MEAEEARARLEKWAGILRAKLEGVSRGPWRTLDTPHQQRQALTGPRSDPAFPKELENSPFHATVIDICCGGEGCGIRWDEDGTFIAFSRSAVPALLAGIERILKAQGPASSPIGPLHAVGLGKGMEIAMIVLAEAIQPYFTEETDA